MNLSGGNQQKAILGRWLSEEMKVILLDEPTRSIDVGAKHEIYNVIYALAAQGVAVLFASSDLPEVLGVADRIVVMREGEIAGELLHEQADERQALMLILSRTECTGIMPSALRSSGQSIMPAAMAWLGLRISIGCWSI